MDIRKLTVEEQRDLYAAVLGAAFGITRSEGIARDLTQQAFVLQATTRPWEPGSEIDLVHHMYGLLRSLWSTFAISNRARIDRERAFAGEQALLSESSTPSDEAKIVAHTERRDAGTLAARRVTALRAILAKLGLSLDLAICEHMASGVVKRADLVAITGRSSDDVKTALARIRRHMSSVLAAETPETGERDPIEAEEESEEVLS